MKSLLDYVLEDNNSYKNVSKTEGKYQREVSTKINFTENDAQKYFDALEKEFGRQYRLDRGFGGSIFFYKPKGQMTMKNLICMVSSNYYIDFGPNKDLVDTLGPKIMEVIDSVK